MTRNDRICKPNSMRRQMNWDLILWKQSCWRMLENDSPRTMIFKLKWAHKSPGDLAKMQTLTDPVFGGARESESSNTLQSSVHAVSPRTSSSKGMTFRFRLNWIQIPALLPPCWGKLSKLFHLSELQFFDSDLITNRCWLFNDAYSRNSEMSGRDTQIDN